MSGEVDVDGLVEYLTKVHSTSDAIEVMEEAERDGYDAKWIWFVKGLLHDNFGTEARRSAARELSVHHDDPECGVVIKQLCVDWHVCDATLGRVQTAEWLVGNMPMLTPRIKDILRRDDLTGLTAFIDRTDLIQHLTDGGPRLYTEASAFGLGEKCRLLFMAMACHNSSVQHWQECIHDMFEGGHVVKTLNYISRTRLRFDLSGLGDMGSSIMHLNFDDDATAKHLEEWIIASKERPSLDMGMLAIRRDWVETLGVIIRFVGSPPARGRLFMQCIREDKEACMHKFASLIDIKKVKSLPIPEGRGRDAVLLTNSLLDKNLQWVIPFVLFSNKDNVRFSRGMFIALWRRGQHGLVSHVLTSPGEGIQAIRRLIADYVRVRNLQ